MAGQIAFSLIPANLRTPGVFVEFDNSKAVRGLVGLEHRLLLLGQRLSGGSKAEGELVELFSADDAKTYFGEGSLLHNMYERAAAASNSVRIYGLALDDEGAGTAATGNVVFTGPATAAGTLAFLVGGRAVKVGVASGDTATEIAAAFVAAVQAAEALPLTAAVNGGDDTQGDLTARHKGLVGNELRVVLNYNQGEATPAGVGVTITQLSGGATNPDVATAIAALGDEWFTDIVMPWRDAANLTALETELLDRWGPLRPIDGHAYIAQSDTVSNLSTFGNTRNSPFVTALGAFNNSPTPEYEVAAVLGAICAQETQQHPARPLTGLTLTGVLAPAVADRFSREERNTLLFDGISTVVVGPGSAVQIDRLITMYQLSPASTPDPSYLDLNTITTLSYLRFTLRVRLSQRFSRSILAKDGTRAAPGQPVVTPRSARNEVVALFDEWEAAALVEDVDQFLDDLVVAINDDPVRLDILLPPNLTNPLLITAVKLEFRR